MHSRTLHTGSTLPLIMLALLAGTLTASAGSPQSTQKGKKKPMTQGHEVAVIETTMGTIEAELYRGDAPKTVENFVGLAGKKYFDGIIFHRVVPGFVIQGGDPTGTGTGGRASGKRNSPMS